MKLIALAVSTLILGACAAPSAVVIDAPAYISPEALAAMQEIAAAAPPEGCHLEVILEKGKVTYQCVGECDKGSCNLSITKKDGKTTVKCVCK